MPPVCALSDICVCWEVLQVVFFLCSFLICKTKPFLIRGHPKQALALADPNLAHFLLPPRHILKPAPPPSSVHSSSLAATLTDFYLHSFQFSCFSVVDESPTHRAHVHPPSRPHTHACTHTKFQTRRTWAAGHRIQNDGRFSRRVDTAAEACTSLHQQQLQVIWRYLLPCSSSSQDVNMPFGGVLNSARSAFSLDFISHRRETHRKELCKCVQSGENRREWIGNEQECPPTR